MGVMHVRQVRVCVAQPIMSMPMSVGFPQRIVGAVLMAVMVVMYVRMRMHGELVLMLVLVGLRQVEPHADSHEHAGGDQLHGHRLAQKHHGPDGAEKRRSREICAGPGGPKMP